MLQPRGDSAHYYSYLAGAASPAAPTSKGQRQLGLLHTANGFFHSKKQRTFAFDALAPPAECSGCDANLHPAQSQLDCALTLLLHDNQRTVSARPFDRISPQRKRW